MNLLEVKLRKAVSILMFFLWVITGITGFLLLIGPILAFHGIYVPGILSTTLHTYISFAFFGLSVIHLALNWNAFKSYFKRVKRNIQEVQKEVKR